MGVMCRLLKVSTSGFYDWRGRPLSQHDRQDVELAALIHTSYTSVRTAPTARGACTRSCVRATACGWAASVWRV